jgi:predicted membrane protein
MTDLKVKVWIVLVTILSPFYLLLGPIVNGAHYIAERQEESSFSDKAFNLVIAPFILLFCGVIGLALAAVLTIPCIVVNVIRFWRIVLTENGLNIYFR